MLNSFNEEFARKMENRLYNAMKNGMLDNNMFEMVMRRSVKHVERFEEFLDDRNFMIRLAAIKIIGKFKEDLTVLINLVTEQEQQHAVTDCIVRIFGEREIHADVLALILEENSMFINTIINSILKQNKVEYLTAILLSDNMKLVNFVKRKIEEHAGGKQETN